MESPALFSTPQLAHGVPSALEAGAASQHGPSDRGVTSSFCQLVNGEAASGRRKARSQLELQFERSSAVRTEGV